MTKLGRYTVEEVLGRGSMGVVYLAHDPRIRRHVAVKTIALPAGLTDTQVTNFRARFLREAQAAGSLTHPGIVTIYGVEEVADQDLPFITMEYVAGRNLEHILLTEGRLVPERAFQMAMTLAEALQTAHAMGVIHRDIKPANILVRDKDGAVKITDFGVARVPTGDLTADGGVLGSPSYMAPEQIRGGRTDERSDLFALAVILYEALSGRRLYGGDDLVTIANKIANDPVPKLTARLRTLPSSVDAFFEKALAKDPAQRFPDAAAFREAINEILFEMDLDSLTPTVEAVADFVVVDNESFVERSERRRRGADPRILAAAGAGVVLFLLAILGGSTMLDSRPSADASRSPAPQRAAETAPAETTAAADDPSLRPGASPPEVAVLPPTLGGATTVDDTGAAEPTRPVPEAASAEPREKAPDPAPARRAVVPSEPANAPADAPARTAPAPAPTTTSPAPAGTSSRAAEPTGGTAEPGPPAEPPALQSTDPAALVAEASAPLSPASTTLADAAIPLESGTLLLVVLSRVKEGRLSVLVDGEELYGQELRPSGKKLKRVLGKVTQRAQEAAEDALEIPAGAHTVTARLQIAGRAAVSEASLDVDLAAGTTRTIEIVAGRKFGMGDALRMRLGD